MLTADAAGAHRIPFARAFELGNFGPHIGEDHRAEGSCYVLGQIEHLYACERAAIGITDGHFSLVLPAKAGIHGSDGTWIDPASPLSAVLEIDGVAAP